MDRCKFRRIVVGLIFGLLLPAGALRGAPLVYVQLLAREDGTDDPFSSTIAPTAVGEEFDWIVVATLAPAGTQNINLPVDANGKQQIGSWQASASTPTANDGLGGLLYALFQNPGDPTQVSFQNPGYIGAGGKDSIDQNIFNGIYTNPTKSGAGASNNDINGNASFTGGVNTISYTFTTSAVTQLPAGHFVPQGVAQSANGYAMFQNYGQATGSSAGNLVTRSGRNSNNDLTNMLAIAGVGSSYLGVDPAIVSSGGAGQSPISVILESGSDAGGATYNNGGGDANGNDSAFMVSSLHSGTSAVSINVFDMNPGNPGGTVTPPTSFLNLRYHDTAGSQVRPGTTGSFIYSTQTSPDPVVQFTGLTIAGSGSPANLYTTVFTFTNGSGNEVWNDEGNWTAGGPPFVAGDAAVFAGNSPTGTVTLKANVSACSAEFVGEFWLGEDSKGVI